jgi:deoxycytidylate deaminase
MSHRSLCNRDQVGAVIIDSDNRVVATGYNGPPWGFFRDDCGIEDIRDRPDPSPCVNWCKRSRAMCKCGHIHIDHSGAHEAPDACSLCGCWGYDGPVLDKEYDDCVSLHAEANALIVCDRSARQFGTIYVTSSVCSTCAKLIANSGLSRVVIDTSSQEHVLYRDPLKWMEFMRDCGLEVVVVSPRT